MQHSYLPASLHTLHCITLQPEYGCLCLESCYEFNMLNINPLLHELLFQPDNMF